jgi:SAM-dependent methyltransferase
VQFVPEAANSVLDVGCWQGSFGAHLKRMRPGIAVAGVEANAAAAELARSRLDWVITGTFPEAGPQDERFDCITFNDVLEHMTDPWSALERARSLLSPAGAVVASIPNIRHLSVVWPLVVRGRWDYTDAGLLDRTHVRFFTRATMIDLFGETGYSVQIVRPLPAGREGKRGALLRLLCAPLGPSASTQLRTAQYVLVAHPAAASANPSVSRKSQCDAASTTQRSVAH